MSETTSVYQAYQGNTYLFGGNAPYVEEMYENYLANPGSVPDTWREYFDALQHVPAVDGSNAKDVPHLPVVNAFAERAKQGGTKVVVASADSEMGRKRTAVQQLIAAYRNVGQRWADLDPLKRTERPTIPELEAVVLRFQRCRPGNGVQHQQHLLRQGDHEPARVAQCAARNLLRHDWRRVHVRHRPEPEALVAAKAGKSIRSKPNFNAERKKHILDRLTAAEGLERFLHTKYVGQKRFSLEGGESFIAAMDELIQRGG